MTKDFILKDLEKEQKTKPSYVFCVVYDVIYNLMLFKQRSKL